MRQEVLFRTEQAAIPGFSLVENYVPLGINPAFRQYLDSIRNSSAFG